MNRQTESSRLPHGETAGLFPKPGPAVHLHVGNVLPTGRSVQEAKMTAHGSDLLRWYSLIALVSRMPGF